MAEVNLFKIYLSAPEKQKGLQRKIRLASLGVLLAYVVVSLAIFSYWLILKRKSERVAENIEIKLVRIEELRQVEMQQVFLQKRLERAVEFFNPLPLDYNDAIDRFEEILSNGITIGSLNLDINGNLEVSGEAAAASVLAEFVERLIKTGNEEFAYEATLDSVNRKEDGIYNFSLKVGIKDAQKAI